MQSTHTSVKTTKEAHHDLAHKAHVLLQLKTMLTEAMKDLMNTNIVVLRMANEPLDADKVLASLQQLPQFNAKNISKFYTKGRFDVKKFVASQTYKDLKALLQSQIKEYLELIQALSLSDINQSVTVTLIIADMQDLIHKNNKERGLIALFFNDELIETLKTSLEPFTDKTHGDFLSYIDYKMDPTHIQFRIAEFIDDEKEILLYAQDDYQINSSEEMTNTSALLESVKKSFSMGADKCSNVTKISAYLDFFKRVSQITNELIQKYELTNTTKKSLKFYDEDLFNRLELLHNHTVLLKNNLGKTRALDHLILNTCQSHEEFEKKFLERWLSVKSKFPNITVDELEKTHKALVDAFAQQISLMEETNQKLIKALKYTAHYDSLRDKPHRDMIQLLLVLQDEMMKHDQSSELENLYTTAHKLYENIKDLLPINIPAYYEHPVLQATLEADITTICNRIETMKDETKAILEELEATKKQTPPTHKIVKPKQKTHVKSKNKFHQKSQNSANKNPSITKEMTTRTKQSSHSSNDSLFNASISDQPHTLFPCVLHAQNSAATTLLLKYMKHELDPRSDNTEVAAHDNVHRINP